MIRLAVPLGAFFAVIALAGCKEETVGAPPPPHALTTEAIGYYCGMNLIEHSGPKGQILLVSRTDPIWFSSARDAVAFTLLPEEPKDIRAIYVSDMARAPGWENPGPNNWVDARAAFFVIGSKLRSGMGAAETVPFSDRSKADKFASEHGGQIVTFAEIPREYVLGSEPGAAHALRAPSVEPKAARGD